ncbi:hypothetical protein GC163_09970 [bacterium]|nr:hypothetical protein [bacterium]
MSADVIKSPDTQNLTSHGSMPLFCTAILLLVAVPLFLRMPLTNDAELFDLQAGSLDQGSVLYRDFLEPNLPGVIWFHRIARTLFGSSTEALRCFDLIVWAGTLTAVAWILRLAGASRQIIGWTVFGLSACYLSQSEWCHCQRDVWMLFPACTALALRARLTIVSNENARKHWLLLAFIEGLGWGLAVWLKPHVVIPGTAAILVSGLYATRKIQWFQEILAILAGGLLAGCLGIGWMWQTGCWPYFLETVRDWNPDYFAAGRSHWSWSRLIAILWRLSPWSLLPFIAVFAGLQWSVRRREDFGRSANNSAAVSALVAVFSLGWICQVLLLQHQFDYVYLPIVLLALLTFAVLACHSNSSSSRWHIGWLAFAGMVIATSPLTSRDRLVAWPACMTGPNSPALQDQLSQLHHPRQDHLAEIAEFLTTQHVEVRDVCCYNSDCVSLYRRLSLLPPVKYTYFFETLQFFPDRRGQVLAEIERQPHRFVVTDLMSCGLTQVEAEAIGPEGPLAPPPAYRDAPRDLYPWNCPVVFRAGSYLVHRVPETVPTVKSVVLAD